MKFVILGAGALGAIYGALLAEAHHDVSLVARGENYTVMSSNGLTIQTSKGSLKPNLRVVQNPKEVGKADVAFVTVKARDTEPILEDSMHLMGRTIFVSYQNSGAKDEILSKYAGQSNVIGGVSAVGATLLRPGIVQHTSAGNTWLGELPEGRSERVEELAKILNDAQLRTEVTDNITGVKWVKLVQFCAYAGLCSLTRLRSHQIHRDRKLTEIFIRLIREGGNVMKAVGVEPENFDHLVPVKRIMELPDEVLIPEYEQRANQQSNTQTYTTVSMLQDVLRGKPIEVEETLGYLVTKALEVGVAVPTLQTVYALLRGVDASDLKTPRT